MGAHYLEKLFSPKSVAVFGASEKPGSVGGRVCRNLMACGFAGPVYPINPKYQSFDGGGCFATLEAVDAPVDLAVIATPAATVPGLIRACGECHVNVAIVLSSGFGERGGSGKALEAALLEQAKSHGVRILGPNCLGLMRPSLSLNATFSNNVAQRGSLGLVSQSGAICTAIRSIPTAIGMFPIWFSTLASVDWTLSR